MIRTPVAMPRPMGGPTQVVFNPQSEALLAQINPQLADLMRRVEAQMPDAFEISEGMRDAARQRELVAQGKSQTLNSRHLTGNAVDIHVTNPDGSVNWDFEAYRPIADRAKALAAEMGLPDFVWGGDWKTLKDGVHFQVGGPGQTQPTPNGNVLSYPAATQPTAQTAAPSMGAPVTKADRMGLLASLGLGMMPQQQTAQVMPFAPAQYRAPEQQQSMALLQFLKGLA
jgi:peptidoglycan LD-endopeptidase CwlK